MSKLAPQTIVFAPGEAARKNFNFTADLDGTTAISATPSFSMQAGGPALSQPAYSGKIAQVYLNAADVAPGTYYCDCTVIDNSTPAQIFKGRGRIVVSNLG